jgi:hypothetical protein
MSKGKDKIKIKSKALKARGKISHKPKQSEAKKTAQEMGSRSVTSPANDCKGCIKIYFAMYYDNIDSDKDRSFERAAKTWKLEIEKYSSFRMNIDTFVMSGFKTEADFRRAWDNIYEISKKANHEVVVGHIFSHASKDDGDDGLEFATDGDDVNDGTLDSTEAEVIKRLNWSSGGQLILLGCNTGLNRSDKHSSPAAAFAKSQAILVAGQTGYAYFSKKKEEYAQIDVSDVEIYLWAYKRGQNGFFGDGHRMSANWFYGQ